MGLFDFAKRIFGTSVSTLDLQLPEAPPAERRVEAPSPRSTSSEIPVGAMSAALNSFLDADPSLRPRLRHLVHVEAAMKAHGANFGKNVPKPVLRQALEQLERSVGDWSVRGLAALRTKLRIELLARPTRPAQMDSALGALGGGASGTVQSPTEPAGLDTMPADTLPADINPPKPRRAIADRGAAADTADADFKMLMAMYEEVLTPDQIKEIQRNYALLHAEPMGGKEESA